MDYLEYVNEHQQAQPARQVLTDSSDYNMSLFKFFWIK